MDALREYHMKDNLREHQMKHNLRQADEGWTQGIPIH